MAKSLVFYGTSQDGRLTALMIVPTKTKTIVQQVLNEAPEGVQFAVLRSPNPRKKDWIVWTAPDYEDPERNGQQLPYEF